MKTAWFFVVVLSLLFAVVAAAQDNGPGFWYGFGSLGAFSDGGALLTHFGGGGDKMLTRNIGVGAVVGYMAPVQNLSEGIGLLDVNGSYYFTRAGSRWVPFVTGGYTLAFREGTANMMNFGGGVNYWWSGRTGMRLEFRDHLYPGSYDGFHQLDFRVGILFH